MHVSPKGRAFIAVQEGRKLCAYPDATGIPTIGTGHTSAAGPPHVTLGMTITAEEADKILARDLLKFEAEVLREVRVPLNQAQFDALVSFTFNCGEGSLRRAAFLSHLNAGDYAAVPRVLQEFECAGGHLLGDLVRRRAAEAAMFEGL